MNKPLITALSALLLSSCGFGGEKLDVADIEDYIEWKEAQTDIEIEPFKADPILVSGIGTVRATPDIAVLTGRIKTEAKVDYKAMDAASKIVNSVQEIIDGKPVDISFTSLYAVEKRDEDCLAHNQKASRRHSDINSDNWFNERELNRREDVRQKLRAPKTRIDQKVCEVTHVENYIDFTVWVRPSGEVSEYIRAFTAAGVDRVDLFGFDFSNYDTLYKEAAEKAVANARQKAEISARIAGTKLTTIEKFSVSRTERQRRFGPQPNIISPHGNRSVTPQQRIAFSDRIIRSQASPRKRRPAPAPVQPSPAQVASFSCWDGSFVFGAGQCPSQPVAEVAADSAVISPARVEYVTIPATYETFRDTVVTQEASTELVIVDGVPVERTIPAVTKQISRRLVKTPASVVERTVPADASSSTTQSNALRESMLSGSKTIRVAASLSYNYETPLDGVIFKSPEEK